MPTLSEQVTSRFEDQGARRSPGDISLAIAGDLGWNDVVKRTRAVQDGRASIALTKAFLGPEPATVFVATDGLIDSALLGHAALFAYHASVPWGVIADREGAILFNSHWVRNGKWFAVPKIGWNDTKSSTRLLEAVRPDEVATGAVEQFATETHRPDETLLGVDDALVDRLDYWRAETLRHTRGIAGVDAKLQTLFSQLFVLRMLEDRLLAPTIDPLRSVLPTVGVVDTDRLRQIFARAHEVVGAELFDTIVVDDIPSTVLGGVIRDLYVPQRLPSGSAQYNFSWIDADILGSAYEKYLSTVLVPAPLAPQLDLLNQPVRGVDRVSVRKAGGVYYTPPFLVQYLADQCVERALSEGGEPDQIPRIADFACGSGSFLVGAADALIRRLRLRDPKRNWARELVNGRHLIGIDIDENAVKMARLNLWTRFAEEPDPLPLPSLSAIVVQGDSLGTNVWSGLPSEYDVVLGNPPFLATGKTPDREELSARFRTAQGRFDYSYLFVELAVSHLCDGGALGMVVPNRLFRNRDAKTIREILTDATDLLAIVDFGSQQVFDGINAYVGTVIARKRLGAEETPATRVRVMIVNDISPRFLGALLSRVTEFGDALRNDSISAYDVPHPRGSDPWLLLSNAEKAMRVRMEDQSVPLSEVAGIYQGIRTGGNDFFIVTGDSGDGLLANVTNGLGESGLIERALLRPVVFGSEIQRYDTVLPTKYLVYPYHNGAVIPEARLRELYPRGFEYLQTYQSLLADRGSIIAGGLKWYELVRKRDEAWLGAPKLIIRDLATETSFAIDRSGATYLVGGTAVVPPESSQLLPLMAYLNSALVTQYLSEITPSFRGGFQKFEPQHLQRIPIPRELPDGGELWSVLGGLATQVVASRLAGEMITARAAEAEINKVLAERVALPAAT